MKAFELVPSAFQDPELRPSIRDRSGRYSGNRWSNLQHWTLGLFP